MDNLVSLYLSDSLLDNFLVCLIDFGKSKRFLVDKSISASEDCIIIVHGPRIVRHPPLILRRQTMGGHTIKTS